ncbi:class A beta-lactamase-related serine hydrolase [bacterium]|nr:MAG: class A beta-lactamase-related serine hydrolase [bacterium]
MSALDASAPWALAEWGPEGRVESRYGGGADEATRFMIGSVTKTVTGRLLAEAALAGILPLDEALPGPRFLGTPITPASLASHLSGLPRLPPGMPPGSTQPYAPWDESRTLAVYRRIRLWRRPGTLYNYSNFGASVLGIEISQRQERSYEDLALDLLRRMGAATSGFDLPTPGLGNDGHPMDPWRMAAFTPAGGLTMTLPDLVAYGLATRSEDSEAARMVREWRPGRSGCLTLPAKASKPTAGLGWHFLKDGNAFHNGQVAGYKSMLLLTADGRGRAVLTASWRSNTEAASLSSL